MAGHTTARQQLHRAPCGGRAERAVVAVRARIPTESAEQKALFVWAGHNTAVIPELRNLFAIPNGGARTAITGARMRDEGARKGVPDVFLAWPGSGGYLGLFLELKRTTGGRVSPDQDGWIHRLTLAGYCVKVCRGWLEARNAICDYLGITHD